MLDFTIDDIDPRLLDVLAEALRRATGMSPNLTGAVRIEGWDLVWTIGGLRLLGRVFGHPEIDDGHRALTSTLVALHLEEGWAVSQNRVYRLGQQFADALH